MKKTTLVLLGLILLTSRGFALDYELMFKKVGFSRQTKLSDTKIGAGLKEALRVGIDKTIQITGRKDGYFANDAIKILAPDVLKKTEPLLRKAGLGAQIDEFVLSMNRAAEKAAPLARDIFVNALMDMSIEDVQKVYSGGDTAATQYFQEKTKSKLLETYRPIIQKAMNDYGVTKNYQTMVSKVPLAKNLSSLNLESYVAGKALNGLFKVLGEQEALIRQNPQARVTKLLQEVFSK